MYSRVDCQFWIDPYIRKAPEDTRTLMLYYLTTPARNIVGLFHLPEPLALYHLSWNAQRYHKALNELIKNGKIKIDAETDLIFIVNFIKWNKPDNGNQVKGAIKVLKELPKTSLFVDLYISAQNNKNKILEPLINALETLSKPFRNGFETLSNTVTVTVTEAVTEAVTATSMSSGDDGMAATDKITKNDVDKILEKYHQILYMLPKVKKLDDKTVNNVKAILKENNFDYVVNIFHEITRQQFLLGNNDRGWKANFSWIMNKTNFAKIINDTYKYLGNKNQKQLDIIDELLNETDRNDFIGETYNMVMEEKSQ